MKLCRKFDKRRLFSFTISSCVPTEGLFFYHANNHHPHLNFLSFTGLSKSLNFKENQIVWSVNEDINESNTCKTIPFLVSFDIVMRIFSPIITNIPKCPTKWIYRCVGSSLAQPCVSIIMSYRHIVM